MKYPSFDHFFTTLANPQRVHILQLLAHEGPRNVSEITMLLNAEQSAISHNLKPLLLCHFVTVTQDGKERIYEINKDTVEPLLQLIDRHIGKYCVEGCKHWE